MKTIAEGIEDEETLRVVRELGVDYGQGFALHRPGPIVETLDSDD
jgi:EAL domain-containing protein (putative c-di-GMP-specific phosphodiesterase class I)